tara:strand:+ start:406 stop:984 length:579 start_codon:yes stop_codon:yes gene_type:complete
MKLKIKNNEIQEIIKGEIIEFPKYSTQLMNLANQNSQGTRPKVVGQLSDLIQEFVGNNIDDWEVWYLNKKPNAINDAVNKVYPMVEQLKSSIAKIDKRLVEKWVKDLVITKTFLGLKFQEAILKRVSEKMNTTYRLASKEEESTGVDGLIGNSPVSIKPLTYKTKMSLNESIDVPIIFYEKMKSGINIEFSL